VTSNACILPTVAPPRLERIPAEEADRIRPSQSTGMVFVHVVALIGAVVYPPTIGLVALALGLMWLRILGTTLGYHRYFSHRTFRTSRPMQFLIAWWAQSSLEKGVLWWAGHHRNHHRFADTPEDIHSPARRGFFWSHIGWILSNRYDDAPLDVIRDMAQYPELRWLDRWHLVPPVTMAVVCFLAGGMPALVWGFFISTVLVWHATFTINSLSHVFGRRRFPTTDTSRNNPWLAVLTLGEGWHNNHHYFCSTARNGFYWWEFDPTWYAIWTLEKLGLVWDVKRVPARVLEAGRRPRPAGVGAFEPDPIAASLAEPDAAIG
jgi:stearoyl-CoA desaturase (Delta-9 desaturase)